MSAPPPSPQVIAEAPNASSKLPVAIVGGGIAGLYAAHLLQKVHNIKVVVLEADSRIGGRIRQETVWGRDWDLGAEFIHGGNSVLKDLVDKLELPYYGTFDFSDDEPEKVNEYYYLGRERTLMPRNTADPDITRLSEVLDSPKSHDIEDQPMLKHLVNAGLPLRVLGLADAYYAKTGANNIETLGMNEYWREERMWDERQYGRDNFRLVKTFRALVEYLAQGLTIKTNWQVKNIDYRALNRITMTNQTGELLQATRVVVTVPLTVLIDNDIKFLPPLPEEKITATKYLCMEPGLKLLVKFSKKFWGESHHIVICADTYFPQFWSFQGDTVDDLVLCAFATANQAHKLSEEVIVDSFLKQLNAIYASAKSGPAPAVANYVGHFLYDWSKNPFIRGAYASTKVGATALHRKLLAQSVSSNVFFAGEATSSTAPSTVHGAMESAASAVEQLVALRKQKKSFLMMKRTKIVAPKL